MSGAALRSTAAVSGLVTFLLSASVIGGQDGCGVTYSPSAICGLKGSTVEMHCSYTPPSRTEEGVTVQGASWFTHRQHGHPVDLRTDPGYAGRVQYSYHSNRCSLRISDLRDSDQAEYRCAVFTSTTNQPDRKCTGQPGVRLSVTGLRTEISKLKYCYGKCTSAELTCQSTCLLPRLTLYNWYKNGERMTKEPTEKISGYFYPEESWSCAVRGSEALLSPPQCVYDQSCNIVTYDKRSVCAFTGSSVDIPATFNRRYIKSKLWFSPQRSGHWRPLAQPEDLRKDPQYKGRVEVLDAEGGHSTLRIRDLRESDSAEYRVKFTTWSSERSSGLPGTTLTVKDTDVQVQVIWSPGGPKLICHSSCVPHGRPSFDWYRNGTTKVEGEASLSYGGSVDAADSFSCAYQSRRSPPVYAPRVPSVSMSSPGDIMKGSSVNLTCSTDANPAASYTWYKEHETSDPRLLSEEPQLVFSSIQSSDSGRYFCAAENQLGRKRSDIISIDVKYGPQRPSVSVSPSAEVLEGSSVTLTCSTDANPAASYTWYKEDGTSDPRLLSEEPQLVFSSIQSSDSGRYFCAAENHLGRKRSDFISINVKYGPQRPSVSMSSSGDIMKGSSVTLTCSTDANPAASYTWYKEHEDSPRASGQIFTISDFTAEHRGNYYCEAQNEMGRSNSTFHLNVLGSGTWKSASAWTISAALLATVLLAAFLWRRRRKADGGERPVGRAQPSMASEHEATRQPDEPLHYSSIRFAQRQEEPHYWNIGPAAPRRQNQDQDLDQDQDQDLDLEGEYTAVGTENASGAPRTRSQEDEEDSFALYSTVNK